jgi:hypothetical protein
MRFLHYIFNKLRFKRHIIRLDQRLEKERNNMLGEKSYLTMIHYHAQEVIRYMNMSLIYFSVTHLNSSEYIV